MSSNKRMRDYFRTTLRATRFVLPFITAFLLAGKAIAETSEKEKLSVISEFVVDAKLAVALRQGLKESPPANAEDAAFKKRVVALPEAVLVRLMAETYGERMSFEEAKEVSDFYKSPA